MFFRLFTLLYFSCILEDGKPPKEGEEVHRPPQNLAEVKKQAEIREKLALIREKRKINQKLGLVFDSLFFFFFSTGP